jgi:hypothetical protein
MLERPPSVIAEIIRNRAQIGEGAGHTPVVLGEPGDAEPLLGFVTLEILGLVFDPFRRKLYPMRALLA